MGNKQINGQKRIKNIKKIIVLFIFLLSLHWISGGSYAVEPLIMTKHVTSLYKKIIEYGIFN